jgi:hypothetical protein
VPSNLEQSRSDKPSLARRGVAVVVVAVVAFIVLHVVVGLIMTVFWVVLAVAAIGAVLWAANQLL